MSAPQRGLGFSTRFRLCRHPRFVSNEEERAREYSADMLENTSGWEPVRRSVSGDTSVFVGDRGMRWTDDADAEGENDLEGYRSSEYTSRQDGTLQLSDSPDSPGENISHRMKTGTMGKRRTQKATKTTVRIQSSSYDVLAEPIPLPIRLQKAETSAPRGSPHTPRIPDATTQQCS